MKIEVTDLDTGTKTTYNLSKNNWRGLWACMIDGGVHMWYPIEAGKPIDGMCFVTSGRRWRVSK